MNFDKWKIRASSASLIMTGEYGLSSAQKRVITKLEDKEIDGKKLTALQEEEYAKLKKIKANPQLSKTVTSYLRKTFRELKYGRRFHFTNKYLQKGIMEEEAGITLLSNFKGRPFFKNEERKFGTHTEGEPDIVEKTEGFDIKCSWSLDTFPFAGDPLDPVYDWQNLVYADLFDKERWTTAYVLVNANERAVYNEKMKFFYAMGMEESEEYYEVCKEIERSMIFDIAKFKQDYPGFDWANDTFDFDIPEEERVVEFVTKRNDDKIEELKDRVVACREYLDGLL